MSIGSFIYTLLFMPLQLLFEVVYNIAYRIIGNPGVTIIVLSLAVNFLVLPLYRRADAMQEEERDMEMKLAKGVRHIKKTFRGDEQMMMLQTFYRQNDYKPTYVLRGATSLFLEIPFFIAAYHFLAGLELLHGVSFGPIRDLGAPDGMLVLGGITVNVLPVIMTAVNFISSYIFTKGFPTKTKVQLFGMAVFFLVFLYDSPAGLVFYWTLNNLFSLIKTICYKIPHPERIFNAVGSLIPKQFKNPRTDYDRKFFTAGCFFLAVLTGFLIPSAIIASSPQEFMIRGVMEAPVNYLLHSGCLSVGMFVIWFGVFYGLANAPVRFFFDRAVWFLCGAALLGHMVFGRSLGDLNSVLVYDNGVGAPLQDMLLNLVLLLCIAGLMYLFANRFRKLAADAMVIGTIAIAVMSGVNVNGILSSSAKARAIYARMGDGSLRFSLSRTGKNVVVLMLDRAIGEYVPYIMNEKPELKDRFDGFTYYENTVSFGISTNFGTPALYGGYDYTPEEIDKRDDVSLCRKQNEALRLMPVLFDENGYDVTVVDPTYANYQWIPDLTIYEDHPEIRTFSSDSFVSEEDRTSGKLEEKKAAEKEKSLDAVQRNNRNFFCCSIVRTAPLFLRELLYNDGDYNEGRYAAAGSEEEQTEEKNSVQVVYSSVKAEGISSALKESYDILKGMPGITDVEDGESAGTFLMMSNDLTHSANLLQEPDYVPAEHVDNSALEQTPGFRADGTGERLDLKMETMDQTSHYAVNMAALLQLGNWFDYLRESGVYDNTRIILVADHGRNVEQRDDMILPDGTDAEWFYPLLMVKDFNSTGFTVSEDLMTNADVPALAFRDLIKDPVNPATGNAVTDDAKNAGPLNLFYSEEYMITTNNGNQFHPGRWYTVTGDMRKIENWKEGKQDSVLP